MSTVFALKRTHALLEETWTMLTGFDYAYDWRGIGRLKNTDSGPHELYQCRAHTITDRGSRTERGSSADACRSIKGPQFMVRSPNSVHVK